MRGIPGVPPGPPPPLPLPPLLARGRAPLRTLGSRAGPLAPHLAARVPLPSPLGPNGIAGPPLPTGRDTSSTRAAVATPAPRPLPLPPPLRPPSLARAVPRPLLPLTMPPGPRVATGASAAATAEQLLLDMVDADDSEPESPTSPTATAKADAIRHRSCCGCLRRAALGICGLLVLVLLLLGAGAVWQYAQAGAAAGIPFAIANTTVTAEAAAPTSTPVLDAHAHFLLYAPTGPIGEQLQAFVAGCVLAQATGRTLVLPLVADDSGGNVTDAARFAWAPLERYIQAAPLRLLPCATASLAQLRQWMGRYPAAAARLQYVLSPTLGSGGAAAAAAGHLLKTYYEGVLLLPYTPPARMGASARSIPQWAAALPAAASASSSAPVPPYLAGAAGPSHADGGPRILAVGPLHALMGSVPAPEAAAVMRHLVVAKRVRELARQVRAVIMEGAPYVGIDAGSDPATVRTCQTLARPDERAVCRMPPLLVDAAIHDVRMTLSAAAATVQPYDEDDLDSVDTMDVPVTVTATINVYLVAHVPSFDTLAVWAPVRYRQAPHAKVVLAPLDVREAMATVPVLKAAGMLTVYDSELGAVERALLEMDMLTEATWFIGSVYRPLSVAVAARRTNQTYMLDATSPYVALADAGDRI